MNNRSIPLLIAVAWLGLAGCAAVPIQDATLDDARVYVHGVRSDPQVLAYAPVEIDQAVITLRRAEDLLERGGNLSEVHQLAQLARDRATLAQQAARTRSAEAAAAAERQRLELAARAREAEAAQRAARDAQLQAETSRRQAEIAQQQAAAAQRQAETARQQAAAIEREALGAEAALRAMQDRLVDLAPKATPRGVVVTLNDIMFERGGAQLQPAGHQAVSHLANYLIAHPGTTISIEGFTDDAGDRYWNEQLSERRALAVQSALAALGVDARRIIVHGFGPRYPVASNDTLTGRQMNRRVEVVISDRGYVVPRV
jgi:outer membrane protein OmpA-like peptidoglycan-associated protein